MSTKSKDRQHGAGVGARKHFPGARYANLPDDIIRRGLNLPVCKDLFPTALGYFKFAQGHNINRSEGIEDHVLIGCVAGNGRCKIDDRLYEIQANQFIFLPAGIPHSYQATESTPWTILWVHYRGRACAEYGRALNLDIGSPVIQVSDIGTMVTQFETLFEFTQYGYDQRTMLNLSTGFGQFLGQCAWHQRFADEPKRNVEERILQSVNFMKNNLHRKLYLKDLADISGVTAQYFVKLFKDRMGASPMDFFIRLKMQEASMQLKLGDQSVTSIAHSVGYSDPLYFSKAFKKQYGLSPAQYRSQCLMPMG